MLIDERIKDTDESICREIRIAKDNPNDTSESAKAILKNLRDLVESISFKEYCVDKGIDLLPNNIKGDIAYNHNGINFVANKTDLKYLKKFHEYLEISMPHFAVNKNISRILVEKYFKYLVKIKQLQKDKYSFDILANLFDYPMEKDPRLDEFYKKIIEKIKDGKQYQLTSRKSGRCYITRKRLIIVDRQILYELTLSPVNENTSKFDRITVYTLEDIPDYYACIFSIVRREVKFDSKDYDFLTVINWQVSIRPCEIRNIGKLFGQDNKISSTYKCYINLMNYLTREKCNLIDLLNNDSEEYERIKKEIVGKANNIHIVEYLDLCKSFIESENKGHNVVKYLLFTLNKTIIQKQLCNYENSNISNLYLQNKTIPFDEMPFAAGLVDHNPGIFELLECFDTENREHELFGRFISNNTESNNELFTNINEIENYDEVQIDNLIKRFNDSVTYPSHKPARHIEKYNNYLYINQHNTTTANIVRVLLDLNKMSVSNYEDISTVWLEQNEKILNIDDEIKKKCIKKLFSTSRVAVIYGSAGTGKTTLISYLSVLFKDYNVLYLANTNPAVGNLTRLIGEKNGTFMTVKKAINGDVGRSCDVLIMDECSTVSNKDMLDVLQKIQYKALVLAGDTYQIEAIRFGNWFSLLDKFLSKDAIHVLENTKRTDILELKKFWTIVRDEHEKTLEAISTYRYFHILDDSLIEKNYDDEIVLCLNYDGLYGINNINRMLQKANKNKTYYWRLNTYKEGDPVLFYESNKYRNVIYNNLKGRITKINRLKDGIIFQIEVDKLINKDAARAVDLKVISDDGKKSIIEFTIKQPKLQDNGDDDDSYDTIVPFQIAYAVSIHKAQGLEYDSVKVVITCDNEENITKNIFYTAVTRAKKNLLIYSTDKTLSNVINGFMNVKNNRDAHLLSSINNISMENK